MYINKKASAQVATFFIVVGLLLFFYTLLLSPEEREEVFEGLNTNEREEFVKTFRFNFELYSTTQDTILGQKKDIQIQSAIWNTKEENITLELISVPQNVFIGLEEIEHNGKIMVKFNNKTIFYEELAGSRAIRVPEEVKLTNQIEISSEPREWWKIFGRNYYDLDNIQIIGRTPILDFSTQTYTFVITPKEARTVDRATLSYLPKCDVFETEKINITLNDVLLSSSNVKCGSVIETELDIRNLNKNLNELVFSSSPDANYTITQGILKIYY